MERAVQVYCPTIKSYCSIGQKMTEEGFERWVNDGFTDLEKVCICKENHHWKREDYKLDQSPNGASES